MDAFTAFCNESVALSSAMDVVSDGEAAHVQSVLVLNGLLVLDALRKLESAGLKTSVMILHGLGGRQLSAQHAAGSAELVRRAPPTYLSTLVVSFPRGADRHAEGFADLPGGGFVPLYRNPITRTFGTMASVERRSRDSRVVSPSLRSATTEPRSKGGGSDVSRSMSASESPASARMARCLPPSG